MPAGKKKTAVDKEWLALCRCEERFLKRQSNRRPSVLNQKLEHVVPEKLKTTLQAAFYKAFQLVFDKGTGVIEKTYQKENQEYLCKLHTYATDLKENRKNLRAFSRQAKTMQAKNLVISGMEGVGTGLLGIGIPDIPVFTAVLLKSIYEIAISYGYDYQTETEQGFILELIKTSLERGEELKRDNDRINRQMEANPEADQRENAAGKAGLLRETADALSEELLYLKFVQGIAVIGVVGGISNSIYLKRITDYAQMKYKRRFLLDRRQKTGI